MKTRAAVVHQVGRPFVIERLELADPGPDEALVRIAAAGVCHSDWNLVSGATEHALPVVAGHEGAGVIEAVGTNVRHIKPGDAVALSWAPGCGACIDCVRGRPALCHVWRQPLWRGVMLDGRPRFFSGGRAVYHFSAVSCFSQFTVVPAASCVPMPGGVPMEVAALIGCAVTTGVGAVMNTTRPPAGASLAVFGAGGVGLSIIMAAKLAGAESIIAVDTAPDKLPAARSFGATDALEASAEAPTTIRRMTGGYGVDYAFDATGSSAAQRQCVEATRAGGTIALVGLPPGDQPLSAPAAALVRQEKTIVGCYYGSADPSRDFPRYARWFAKGDLPIDRLIARRYRLEQINEAYADLLRGEPGRGVIVFD